VRESTRRRCASPARGGGCLHAARSPARERPGGSRGPGRQSRRPCAPSGDRVPCAHSFTTRAGHQACRPLEPAAAGLFDQTRGARRKCVACTGFARRGRKPHRPSRSVPPLIRWLRSRSLPDAPLRAMPVAGNVAHLRPGLPPGSGDRPDGIAADDQSSSGLRERQRVCGRSKPRRMVHPRMTGLEGPDSRPAGFLIDDAGNDSIGAAESTSLRTVAAPPSKPRSPATSRPRPRRGESRGRCWLCRLHLRVRSGGRCAALTGPAELAELRARLDRELDARAGRHAPGNRLRRASWRVR